MGIRRNTGFTLIEMTVSLVLLSFISIIGYQGLVFGINQWLYGNKKMSFQYEYYQAINWMRIKLGSAEMVKHINAEEGTYLFVGNADNIIFVSTYNRSSVGGLYVNEIKFSEGNNQIYISYYLYHPDSVRISRHRKQYKVDVMSDVKSVSFAYYGQQDDQGKKWHSKWTSTTSLPGLVRVSIVSKDDKQYESTVYIETSNNA